MLEFLLPWGTFLLGETVRCLVFILLAPSLSAVTVRLAVEPGSISHLEYRTDLGVATSQTIFGGELVADITLDPATGQPTALFFTGGQLTYSDSVTSYLSHEEPQTERLTLESRGTAATLASIVAEPVVNAGDGSLSNEEHTLNLNEGTLDVTYELAFLGIWYVIADTERDFAVDPTTTSLSGTTSIHLVEQAENVLGRSLDFRLVHEAETTPQEVNVSGLDVTTVTTGGFTALGRGFEPSAGYVSWSGNPAVDPESKHPTTGESLGVLYALGLGPDDRIPLAIEGGEVRVAFPAEGSRGEVALEFSSDLQEWEAPPTVFPAGTSGEQFLPLPAGSGFVRLRIP